MILLQTGLKRLRCLDTNEDIKFSCGVLTVERHVFYEWYMEVDEVENIKLFHDAFYNGKKLEFEIVTEDNNVYRGKVIIKRIENRSSLTLLGSGKLHGFNE